MLTIKNNLMSANAARHLSHSYDSLSESVEHLSSGQRINRASDDAAGLAVREYLRSEVAALKQGARNTADAINLLQTVEGAMSAIDSALIRMKQLAEQAATESYSETQRRIMDDEFKQMAEEIDRITGASDFNSIRMLDSATGSTIIHFCRTSYLEVSHVDVTSTALGIDSATAMLTGADGTAAQTALTQVTTAIERKDSARAYFGGMMNRLESSMDVIGIEAENLIASESRISDADVAVDMASLTRSQVISEAGVAMLSQANVIPKMGLQLLNAGT